MCLVQHVLVDLRPFSHGRSCLAVIIDLTEVARPNEVTFH